MAQPLYQLTKEAQKVDTHILTWESDSQAAFQKLKQVFLNALVLSLPMGHHFKLHVDERQGMSLEVPHRIRDLLNSTHGICIMN